MQIHFLTKYCLANFCRVSDIKLIPLLVQFFGLNEVVAKVIFLHLSVIHSVHGGGLHQCMLGYHTPPGPDPPLPRADTPPGQTPTPRTRPPQSRPPQHQTPPADTPPGPDPPGPDTPGKQTPAYGLRAAGTHPTGMHSCNSNY